MSIWILLILCVVQGLAEFLPVSSSGHLLFVEQIFGVTDSLLLLNLFLHISTLIAVIIVYRKTLLELIKKPFQPLMYKLILSTAVTVVFAGIYKVFNVDSIVQSIYGFCFLITAALLFITHKFQTKGAVVKAGELSYKNALLVGMVQGIAVLPGVSRSGSTISAMILTGNDETTAAEYSFLLSIPVIVGGFIVEVINVDNWKAALAGISPWVYFFAFVLTFCVALISLKLTIKLFKEKKFVYFAIYLLVFGLIVLGYNFFK